MISCLILARGIPSIVAQGMLFVMLIGFISFIIEIIKAIKDDLRNRKIRKQKEWEEIISKGSELKKLDEKPRSPSKPIPRKYSVILTIRGCFATETIYNTEGANIKSPILFDVEKIETTEGTFTPKIVFQKREIKNAKIGISEIDEDINTWWKLQIEGDNFDSNLLEFISFDEIKEYDWFTRFNLANVIYNGKIYPLFRIERESDVSGYQSAAAFDNWINIR